LTDLTDLTDKQKAEYFRRSYTAVDGLWFMMVEEKYGFEAALKLDEAVWKVLPKIQARTIKAMMKLPYGLEGLQEAVAARLCLEGFVCDLETLENGFEVIVKKCPWHDLMIKAGREELSEKVGDLICRAENSAWALEFTEDDPNFGEIRFERRDRICRGSSRCTLRFCRVSVSGCCASLLLGRSMPR
jgi:Family of unknown function (DUF6125)/L-2-amino-thiazoline-4-carboxylic acid hydrolase